MQEAIRRLDEKEMPYRPKATFDGRSWKDTGMSERKRWGEMNMRGDASAQWLRQPQATQTAALGMQDVTSVLLKVGMPVGLQGFDFLRTAVMMQLREPSVGLRMTKDVYPAVAKQFGSTSGRVERSIRHAIQVAWAKGNPEMWNALFHYSPRSKTGCPTNGELLATLTEWLRLYAGNETF